MLAIGLSAAGISLVAAPLACTWAWISYKLGKRQEQIAVSGLTAEQAEYKKKASG